MALFVLSQLLKCFLNTDGIVDRNMAIDNCIASPNLAKRHGECCKLP